MRIHVYGSDVPACIDSFDNLPQGECCLSNFANGVPKLVIALIDEVALVMMLLGGDMRRVLLSNIEDSDWKEPTPIQMQAIPVMVSGRVS